MATPARKLAPAVAPTQAPGPRKDDLLVVDDFASAEVAVQNGVDSSRIVVLQGQDEATAVATAVAAARAGIAAGRGPLPSRPHAAPGRTLVVLPTYNEKDNLEPMLQAILAYAAVDVLVVDDGSPDGTGAIADRIAASNPRVTVLHRSGKQGLGTAYLAGFAEAFVRGYEFVCEMDCDFSHAPWDLPRLLAVARNCDLAIGSRYVRGGCTVGWDFRRRMLSRGANLYTRMWLSSGIRDNTAGFRCFRTSALQQLDLAAVSAQGYAFQIEMAFRMVRAGFEVREAPIHFVDRQVGKSKMSGKVAREALMLVPKLRFRVKRGRG